jgi:hypothetical protein
MVRVKGTKFNMLFVKKIHSVKGENRFEYSVSFRRWEDLFNFKLFLSSYATIRLFFTSRRLAYCTYNRPFDDLFTWVRTVRIFFPLSPPPRIYKPQIYDCLYVELQTFCNACYFHI